MMRVMRLCLIAALGLAIAARAWAAQAIAVSVEELARSSDAVVRGKVESARPFRSADGLRIFTAYEVRARAVLRGKAPAVARVVVPGGVEGKIGQVVDAAPTFAPGEELVVFLRRSPDGAFVVSELAQGKFAVSGGVARPDLSRLAFVGSQVRAGERRVEEMPVVELEQRVKGAR